MFNAKTTSEKKWLTRQLTRDVRFAWISSRRFQSFHLSKSWPNLSQNGKVASCILRRCSKRVCRRSIVLHDARKDRGIKFVYSDPYSFGVMYCSCCWQKTQLSVWAENENESLLNCAIRSRKISTLQSSRGRPLAMTSKSYTVMSRRRIRSSGPSTTPRSKGQTTEEIEIE